jgi:hypothetical protein
MTSRLQGICGLEVLDIDVVSPVRAKVPDIVSLPQMVHHALAGFLVDFDVRQFVLVGKLPLEPVHRPSHDLSTRWGRPYFPNHKPLGTTHRATRNLVIRYEFLEGAMRRASKLFQNCHD